MYRILTTVVAQSVAAVSKAFVRAWQETSQRVAKEGINQTTRAATRHGASVELKEARMILGVEENATREEIQKRYDHLFEVNDKAKGGSFYLQSKVFRAKEALDLDMYDGEEEEDDEDDEDDKDEDEDHAVHSKQ